MKINLPLFAKMFLFVFAVAAQQAAYAQKIRFCDMANRWLTCGNYSMDPNISFVKDLRFSGDTTIYGYTYLRMEQHFFSSPSNYLVREDTAAGRVFYRLPELDTAEHLLYDYNLQPGDTMKYAVYSASPRVDTVMEVDSVLIDGVYHRTFTMNNVDDYRAYAVIEGIGATNNPLWPTYFIACFEYYEQLRVYTRSLVMPAVTGPFGWCWNIWDTFVNGSPCPPVGVQETVRGRPVTVHPNPARDWIAVSPAKSTARAEIMNMQGQAVISIPAVRDELQIDISRLPNGVYLLCLQHEDGSREMCKIVKE